MALALTSLVMSFIHLGEWSTVLALGIAIVKASIIAALFMHLVQQPSISRWAFAFGIGLALLLLAMIAIDVLTREPTTPRPPIAWLTPSKSLEVPTPWRHDV